MRCIAVRNFTDHHLQPFYPDQPVHTLRMWVQFGIFDSVRPAAFVSTSKVAGRTPAQLANDGSLFGDSASCLRLYLQKEISPGVGYGGIMGLPGQAQIRPVFVKLAFPGDEGSEDRLLREHNFYMSAASTLSGVPSSFGLFDSLDEGGPRVLLLSHEGQSLADRCNESKTFHLSASIK